MPVAQFFIIYKNGDVAAPFYAASSNPLKHKNTHNVWFICKRENKNCPPYGDHLLYSFCDTDGNNLPLTVRDCIIHNFVVYGTMRNRILSWEIESPTHAEEYALHRDDYIYAREPYYDNEWDQPIPDTVQLIRDIQHFGLDTRKELDSLKRDIYSKNWSIHWKFKRYRHLKDIDYEKSGLHLSTYAVEFPHLEKEYKEQAYIKSRLNVQEALAFLRDELEKRERTLSLLEERNEILENYASSLETVFIKDGVETIEDRQFEGCKNAITIVLPPSVTCIVHTAFNSTSIESVYINSPVLVNLIASFPVPGSMLSKAKFYVPSKLVEKYQTSMSWKKLSDRILAINDEGQR